MSQNYRAVALIARLGVDERVGVFRADQPEGPQERLYVELAEIIEGEFDERAGAVLNPHFSSLVNRQVRPEQFHQSGGRW